MLLVRLADESASFLPFGVVEGFTADLGLSYAQVGWIFFLIAPGAWLGNIATVAADVMSRRIIAAGGAFGYAAALCLFAVGDGFAALAAAALLLGASSTAMVDGVEVALVDAVGDDLAPYLARSNLLGIGGELGGPALLVGVLALGWSWRVAFVVAAVLLAVYGLWLACLPFPHPHRRDGDDEGHRAALAGVLRDPRVWALGAVSVVLVPLDEPFFGFLIAFLQEERGWTGWAATALAATTVIGGILAYSLGGRVLVRVGERRSLVISSVGVAVAVLVLVGVAVPGALVLGGVAFGAAVGVVWLGLQHRVLTLRPGRAGAVKAVVSTVESVGFAVPVAIGALADGRGLTFGMWCYAALPLALLVAAVAATLGSRR